MDLVSRIRRCSSLSRPLKFEGSFCRPQAASERSGPQAAVSMLTAVVFAVLQF